MIKHMDEKASKSDQNNFGMASTKSAPQPHPQQQHHRVNPSFSQATNEQYGEQTFDTAQCILTKAEPFKDAELYRNDAMKTGFYQKDLGQAPFFRDMGEPENYTNHQLIRFPQDKYPSN